jgi:hypothetical protein
MFRPLLAALLLLAPVAHASEPEGEPPAAAPSEETEPAGKVGRHDTDDVAATKEGADRFSDPGRTRYLFGNSALMLRGGEGFFSQRELLFSMVSLGLTDHVTVSVGSAVPVFVADRRYLHMAGGLKVGGAVSERVHLAAGVEGLVLPVAPSTLGLVYGVATYGIPDAQLSLSVGVPFSFSSEGAQVAHLFAGSLGGSLRLSHRLAGVTENWVLMGPTYQAALVNSLALRILGERWTVDLGALRATGIPIPLPWVNFSWHWD